MVSWSTKGACLILAAGLAVTTNTHAQDLAESASSAFRDWSITEVLVPDHLRAAETASGLVDAMEGYCAGDTHDVQAAFDAAMQGYQRIQWVTFGPAFLFDRRFRINLWPDNSNAVSRQLGRALSDQPAALTTVEGVSESSIALQGFSALERLLYPDLPTPGTYSCHLAMAISGNIAALIADTSDDWGRPDQMPQIGLDRYLQTVITSLAGSLDAVATRKVMAVLGASADDARPRRAENWRSGNSLANLATNAESARSLLIGGAQTGVDWLLAEAGAGAIAERLTLEMEAVEGHLETLAAAGPVEGITDPAIRETVLGLAQSLEEVRFILRDEVAPALGIIVGFNSLDGD